jgi:hypothetical protein
MKTFGLILLGFLCGVCVFGAWYWGTEREQKILFLEPPVSVPETPWQESPANPPARDVEIVAGEGSVSPSVRPLGGADHSPFFPMEPSPVDISPEFQTDAVKAFVKQHPNSPLRFVPKDANALQLSYLETEAEVILKDWQERRDALWSQHRENLLSFTVDPSVIQNDKDRQAALKGLVNSLWPGAMP